MRAIGLAMLAVAMLSAPAFAEKQPPEDMRERIHKRIRLMRLVELSGQLELDEAQALRVNEVLDQFEQKKHLVRDQMKRPKQVLEQAAKGATTTQKDLDAAVKELADRRQELMDLNQAAWRAASRELSVKQQAGLALFLSDFQRKVYRLAREAVENGD